MINGMNQTDGTRDALPVWSHPSKKAHEVKQELPDKCETILLPSKKSYDVMSGRCQGTSSDWAWST